MVKGTRIDYAEQQIGFCPRSDRGPKITVDTNRRKCPFSHVGVGDGDPRMRYLLVNGEKVRINIRAMKKRCDEEGWVMPEFAERSTNAEKWLVDMARELAAIPMKDLGDRLVRITRFAKLIGQQADFLEAIKSE